MKIYYGKKLIILKELSDTDIKQKNNIFIYKNNKQLKEITDFFFEKEEPEEITVLHTDIESLKENFKLNFKYIEAAGGLVYNQKKEVLIIQRFGVSDLPKGKVEKGETLKETAIREVEEECGISDLKIIKELESTYHIYIRKDKRILKRTYWFEMNYSGTEKPVPQTEEEIEYARFTSKEDIPELLRKTYYSLINIFEYILK